MARDVESLVLRMSADLRRFEKSMDSMRTTADRRLNEVERRALASQKNLTRTMGEAGNGMVAALRQSLSALAPTLAGAFSTAAVIQYADAWTAGRNALAAAGVATGDLARRQNELVDLASETRTGTAETIALYQRLSIATKELGLASSDTLRLTELLNKSFQSSGLSTQEAASAALQLSQALASGTLQGDELRSLRENAPLVAKAIADSMGVGIGALKELGAEGKITSQVIVDALFGASDQINATFSNTSVTVGQSLTILNNELGRFIGTADSGLSATERLAQGIVTLANNLDRIVPVATALAALITGRFAVGMATAAVSTGLATLETIRYQATLITLQARQTGATSAQVALNAAMSANPIGLIVTLVAALAAGILILSNRYGEAARLQREIASTAQSAASALDEYEQAARDAASATGQNAAQARENAARMREEAVAAVNSARALRQRTAALAAQRAQEAAREVQELRRSVGPGQTTLNQGQLAAAQGRLRLAEQADRAAADEAFQAGYRLAEIENNARTGAYRPTGPATVSGADRASSRASGRTGPTPEEQAAQRELLRLEAQVQLLRAQGREAEADAGQRRIDTLNLAKRLSDAGVANAQEEARIQVDAVANAEAAARGREFAAQRTQVFLEAANEALERQNEITRDRLGYEAELARLTGSDDAIRTAERRLFIEERSLELVRLKLAATKEEAAVRAGAEFDALDSAEREGAMRDEFRRSFSEGIRAAIDGDIGGFFESLADRFTDRMLDNLADDLFDLVSQAAKGFGGGGGGSGGNILSAIASVFTGGRQAATGRRVVGGYPVLTGERRPEIFVPSTSGTILPNVEAAMNRAQSLGGRQVIEHRITVSPERDSFIALASDAAAPMVAQGGAALYGAQKQEQAMAQRRARQRFV